jgi:Tfp pilus assembly protein PilX
MDTLEKKTQTPDRKKGSGLIFAVILLFVILGMVVTLASVTVLETKMNQKTKSSVGAFYDSESGVEWALNKIATSSGTISTAFTFQPDHSVNCPDAFGTDTCKVFLLDQNGKVITDSSIDLSLVKAVRSVGSQGGDTQRAIEAAVASGAGGCYVDYSLPTGLAVGSSCGAVGGFTVKKSAGMYGGCFNGAAVLTFRPPGAACRNLYVAENYGEAYVCCM